MRVKLEKFESTNNNLRTKTVIGDTDYLPELNMPFEMTAEPLTPGASFRLVTTSFVTEILAQGKDFVEFKTLNSNYRVDILNA